MKESAACFCSACKALRITDTKQLIASETYMAIKQRNTSAMKNTCAGPGHGGSTPPARTGLPVRGKAGNNRSGKACFSPAVFPAFLGALGPSYYRVPKVTAAHCLNYALSLFRKCGSRGIIPLVGLRGKAPRSPPGVGFGAAEAPKASATRQPSVSCRRRVV